MKAFLLDTAGDVENLYQAEIEIPIIKSNEVLVKVASVMM